MAPVKLFDAFGSGQPTLQEREDIEAALARAGVSVNPTLAGSETLPFTFALRLTEPRVSDATAAETDVRPDAAPVMPAPLGVGLAILGAAVLVVSAFLPYADVSGTGFSSVAKNTLLQHGNWVVLVAAAVITFDVIQSYVRRRPLPVWSVLWAPVVAVIVLVITMTSGTEF